METAADFNGQTWKLASYAEEISYDDPVTDYSSQSFYIIKSIIFDLKLDSL